MSAIGRHAVRYDVRALGAGGKLDTLSIEADNEQAACVEAERRGLSVLSVRSAGTLALLAARSPAVRRAFSLRLFAQEFVALLDAGLSATETLEALAAKAEGHAGERLRDVLAGIRAGLPLSEAFEQAGADFPPLFVATVRASERTGDLRPALGRYSEYLGKIDELRAKVRAALVYPAMLGATGLSVAAFLLLFVVPRFSRIFEDIGGNLPLPSRVLMQGGQWLAGHGALVVVTCAAIAFALAKLAARPEARERLRRFAWRMPRLGEAMRLYDLARFYRTMGMLLRSGLPLVGALAMARGLLAPSMRPSLDAAARRISEGLPASASLAECGLATTVGLSMLRVGERTGELGHMMERIASFHDDELARGLDLATRLFEPVLMAVVGVVIGGIVVLLYLPIFELANALQ